MLTLQQACLAVVLAASTTLDAAGIELMLRERAVPQTAVVRLGDVADLELSDSANPRQRLADVPLMPAPAAGTECFLKATELRDILVGRGVDVRSISWAGASVVAISPTAPANSTANAREAVPNTSHEQALDDQDRAELLTNAIIRYLAAETGHELWRVKVELEPVLIAALRDARANLTACGGRAPWSGRQRFEVTTDANPSPLNVYARVDRLEVAVFATQPIAKGDLIRRSAVELRTHVSALPAQAAVSLDAVVGMEAVQGVRPDSMIAANQIRSPIIVRRNERVSVRVRGAGVVVRTYAVAQQDGSLGELVLVQSGAGKERYAARVTGLRELEITAAGTSASELTATN